MKKQVALSNHARMLLIEQKSQGIPVLVNLLTSLVLGNRINTEQVNRFLSNCRTGNQLLSQFEAWKSDNQESDFETFALIHF